MIEDTPIIYKNVIQTGDNYNPTVYLPQLGKKDYDLGYIDRYFVGKRNQNDMIETSPRDYNMTDVKIYKKIKISWKISGPEYNVYNGKVLETTGVVNYNNLSIRSASQVFKNAKLILFNTKQFWRGF